MQLVERHIYKRGHEYFSVFDRLSFLSKNLYNATLYEIRQQFFADKTYIPYVKLQQRFQESKQPDYRALPAKVAQQTMKLVDQNFRSFFRAIKAYGKNPSKFTGRPKLPKYLKKKKGRFELVYTNQAISKRVFQNEGLLNLSGTDVRIKTKLGYEDICQVRVVKRVDAYIVEIVYNSVEPQIKDDNGRIAAIDLGVNNLATVTTNIEGYVPFVISGRWLKSVNQFYNKQRAKMQSRLEKCNKKKNSKAIDRLTFKRNNRVGDFLHKASRIIVNQLVSDKVTTLVVGHNRSWKQDINIGAVNNQNFVDIPHSRFIAMLKYKCALEGICFIETEESHTSKCSFLDGEEICHHDKYMGRRVKRGLFKTANGRLINADVNGSYNIMCKCRPNAFPERGCADGVVGAVVHPVILKKITN